MIVMTGCGNRVPLIGRMVSTIVAVCVLALGVQAQTAPAGNAHPEMEAQMGAEIANPFGTPGPTKLELRQKEAFSKAIDLEPLRDLAVYHQGRIKILDTLARESVSTILGRRNYQDFEVVEGKKDVRRVAYDPLFTYLDLVIDPGYYVDRPLVHVEFLPLREAFLERMYASTEEREWWLRVGRLKPIKIAEQLEAIEQKHGFEPAMRGGLEDVRSSMMLYQNAWRDLTMVAAEGEAQPWKHLANLPAESALGKAMRELGTAWREGDATRVNAAVKVIGAELPKVNGGMYPTTRRSLERAYNRANAFEWGFWVYGVALLTLLLAFGTGRRWLLNIGVTALVIGLGLHAFGFISRCIIAERFAIQNQFESMTGLSLFGAVVGVALMIGRRQPLFGAAAAGVGFMVLITATQTGIPGVRVEREAPILNTSVLLKYHVTTVLVSYALISLGFMVSLFYLGTHYAARLRAKSGGPELATVALGGVAGVGGGGSMSIGGDDESAGVRSGPSVLKDLDKAQMIILQLAFWTLGVGILLGAWWADHSWGRWWAFDPKEVWALVTWIVYLIVIHVRVGELRNRGLTTAWLSVVGFFVMLWTYFGVNLLLPGLHAYA